MSRLGYMGDSFGAVLSRGQQLPSAGALVCLPGQKRVFDHGTRQWVCVPVPQDQWAGRLAFAPDTHESPDRSTVDMTGPGAPAIDPSSPPMVTVEDTPPPMPGTTTTTEATPPPLVQAPGAATGLGQGVLYAGAAWLLFKLFK